MARMWSDAAKQAAEQEFGRRNYRTLAFARSLPAILVVAAVIGAAVGVRWAWVSWEPGWSRTALYAAAAVVALFLLYRLATRSKRRGYRMPRRSY